MGDGVMDMTKSGALKLDTFAALWSYYDWAVTGANCMVYLHSKEDKVTRLLKNVPVIGVGYEIQQQKTPLYGYADTGPRTIMTGQRVVSGELIIAHKQSGYLEHVLMDVQDENWNTTEKLDLKEELKLKYWNTRDWDDTFKDPQRRNFKNERDQYNLFYRHPNFDISIVYSSGDNINGLPGLNKDGYLDLRELLAHKSSWMASDDGTESGWQDVNPMYRPGDSVTFLDLTKQRETIVGVQLVNKRKNIAADGEIIVEGYSFLAYDVLNK